MTTQRVGYRAFARIVGCSHSVVSRAAVTGRLPQSVLGHDSKGPYIADLEGARRAWTENVSKAPSRGNPRSAPVPAKSAAVLAVPLERLAVFTDADVPGAIVDEPLVVIAVTDKPGDDYDLDKSFVIPMTRQTAYAVGMRLLARCMEIK